jgi:hypothetical protein
MSLNARVGRAARRDGKTQSIIEQEAVNVAWIDEQLKKAEAKHQKRAAAVLDNDEIPY